MELNKEQKRAVNHDKGPMIVIAGAGTGKTRVITERICRLLTEKKASAEEILAVTFTEKAAGEMLERIDLAMPYGYGDLWVLTFHGLCDRILRESAIHIGLNPGYELMNYPQQIALLRQNLFKKFDMEYFRPLNNPYRFIDALIKHVSRLQDEDVSPEEYLEFAKKCEKNAKSGKSAGKTIAKLNAKKTAELARFYQTYQELKRDSNKMDFGDLIYNTLYLFRQRPNVLAEYQKRFKYVLVDEFQDTNYTQNEIALLLAEPENNIMVVGDDDQAIYRFRGASISNILQFEERFPQAEKAVLVENYRSDQKILDGAYQVITQNNPYRLEVKAGVDKKLVSKCDSGGLSRPGRDERNGKKGLKRSKKEEKSISLFKNDELAETRSGVEVLGDPIELFRFQREFDEADFIAQKVMELAGYGKTEDRDANIEIRDKKKEMRRGELSIGEGLPFEEIAILVRAHAHLASVVDRLRFYGVPYQFAGNSDLFNRPVVKDMMALLKVMNDHEDNLSMYRVASFPGFGLGEKALSGLVRQSRYSGECLYSALQRYVIRDGAVVRETRVAGGLVENLSFGGIGSKTGGKEAKRNDKGGTITGKERLEELFSTVESTTGDNIRREGLTISLFNILKQIDYISVLEIEKHDQAGLASLYEFLNLLKSYEAEGGEVSLQETLEFLENIETLGGVDQGAIDYVPKKGVQLMTVHGSKGLEFETVIVPSLVRDRFPGKKMPEQIPIPEEVIKEVLPDKDAHLQEERRLFYVAVTRAKRKLVLTFSDYYAEGKQKRAPSTFLSELLGENGLEKLKVMEYGKVADSAWRQTGALGAEPKLKVTTEEDQKLPAPATVSFSQLDVYNKCPTQYYFSYVVGLKAPASAVLSFGNTVHSALKKFYELQRTYVLAKRTDDSNSGSKRARPTTAVAPQLDDLLRFYEESWISAGYKNKRYEEKRKESGRIALTNYYNSMYKDTDQPIKLEEGFRAQFGKTLVVGKVDRVDWLDEKARTVKIVDYKSGADKEKIEEHEKLQLAIYAYAIKDRWGFAPEKMAIIRVEGGREIEMDWDEKWLDKAKEFVLNTVKRIGTRGFPARPGFICEYCDYRNICNWAKR